MSENALPAGSSEEDAMAAEWAAALAESKPEAHDSHAVTEQVSPSSAAHSLVSNVMSAGVRKQKCVARSW